MGFADERRRFFFGLWIAMGGGMSLFQDVRFAVRMLFHNPGFLAIAGVSLALGIGASTAIFSVLHTVLLQGLPVPNSKQLVGLYPVPRGTHTYNSFSYMNYEDFRSRNRSFSDVMAYAINPFNLSSAGGTERIWGDLATANYFSVLGVQPILGRTFVPEEDRTPGGHPVVILSFRLWTRRFGSDPSTVGRGILLNGQSYTVIGVTPKSFHGTELGLEPDIWIPMMMQAQAMPGWNPLPNRGDGWLRAVGRLKPGVSMAQAAADSERIASQLERQYPHDNGGTTIAVIPNFALLPQFRHAIGGLGMLLASLVGTLLLISCVNLAALLLARISSRANEIAMRMALGARRTRLIRQLLTESVLISCIGGAGGTLIGVWLLDVITRLQSASPLPSFVIFEMNRVALGFALLLSVATGIIFGLGPALLSTRKDLAQSIKSTSAGRGARISNMRSVLVSVQIGMAFLLLATAGLFLKSFQKAARIDPGFAADRTAQLSFDLGAQGYSEERARSFVTALKRNLQGQPGIVSSGFAALEPLGLSDRDRSVFIEGPASTSAPHGVSINYNVVSDSYFGAMSIPILAGRAFTRNDNQRSAPVVIVNETMAHRFWPGVQDATGRRISLTSANGPFAEVVGVCRDSKYLSVAEQPLPYFYMPLKQDFPLTLTAVVGGTGEPASLLRTTEAEVHRMDKSLPVYHAETMRQRIAANLTLENFTAKMLSFFGLTALLLASVGLYGSLSQLVQQRTREMGIRIALGATQANVLLNTIGRGLAISGLGLAVGIGGAYLLSSALASKLIGVSATDPLVLAMVAVLLTFATFLASFVPSYRAAHVDPIVTLHYE